MPERTTLTYNSKSEEMAGYGPEASGRVIEFTVDEEFFESHPDLPRNLPEGYGFKGGVARSALLWVYGESSPIRDYDIVAMSEIADLTIADDVAKRHNSRDFKYGDGVEIIDDISKYFDTRDFTINEALLIGNRLIVTTEAVRAVESRKIEGTKFELEYFGGRLGPKLELKAWILMLALEKYTSKEWSIENNSEVYFSDFYIALAINKALSYGTDIAESLMQMLIERGVIVEDVDRSKLLSSLHESFTFDNPVAVERLIGIDTTEGAPYEDYEIDALEKFYGAKTTHLR